MSLGIALVIQANLGATPWDVLHIGLFKHFGLTVGTWSILVGSLVVGSTCLLTKSWPKAGALANMILVGLFIDFFLAVLPTPEGLWVKWVILMLGIFIQGLGISIYIAANRGAGPRDSLMLYLVELTGWKLSHIRRAMEGVVLLMGWLLGGPVSIGTILFGLTIGSIVGILLPISKKMITIMLEGRAVHENIDKRKIRTHHHDGISKTLR